MALETPRTRSVDVVTVTLNPAIDHTVTIPNFAAGKVNRVQHGGIFAMLIPRVVTNRGMYIVAILVGTLATTGAIFFLKRPVSGESPVEQTEPRVAAA